MSTPPPSNTPSSSSSSADHNKDPSSLRGKQKEFRLDKKKEENPDFAADLQIQQKMQRTGAEQIAQEKTAALSGVEAKAATAKVAELIQRMVDQMRVSASGRAEMDLKATNDIPDFLRNTTLEVSQTAAGGIAVHIGGFKDMNQQARAIAAIEKDTTALRSLVANLQQKNINMVQLTIGAQDHVVAIPKVEAVPLIRGVEQITPTGPERQRREEEPGQGGGKQGQGRGR